MASNMSIAGIADRNLQFGMSKEEFKEKQKRRLAKMTPAQRQAREERLQDEYDKRYHHADRPTHGDALRQRVKELMKRGELDKYGLPPPEHGKPAYQVYEEAGEEGFGGGKRRRRSKRRRKRPSTKKRVTRKSRRSKTRRSKTRRRSNRRSRRN